LQNLAAKRHQEFVGNGQHDAQELLTILLDAIHEVKNIQVNLFFFTRNFIK
jgi:ubiquitin C-terminal hydrolase